MIASGERKPHSKVAQLAITHPSDSGVTAVLRDAYEGDYGTRRGFVHRIDHCFKGYF